jgi:RimJ/RimL family protein N-acetyltransferase
VSPDAHDIRLEGPTVSLVPLSPAHLADLTRHGRDPALWRWWVRAPPLDEATMRQEIALALMLKARGERIPFAILQRASGEHIGSTSYLALDSTHQSVEIGATWLARAFHGGTVNRECKELLLAHAFTRLAINRVVLQTDALNLRSRRAIEKLGARLEGILREDKIVWDGRVRSSAVYSILRAEWPACLPVP